MSCLWCSGWGVGWGGAGGHKHRQDEGWKPCWTHQTNSHCGRMPPLDKQKTGSLLCKNRKAELCFPERCWMGTLRTLRYRPCASPIPPPPQRQNHQQEFLNRTRLPNPPPPPPLNEITMRLLKYSTLAPNSCFPACPPAEVSLSKTLNQTACNAEYVCDETGLRGRITGPQTAMELNANASMATKVCNTAIPGSGGVLRTGWDERREQRWCLQGSIPETSLN